jgi:uncharacterized protein YigE (DUF2233 family)
MRGLKVGILGVVIGCVVTAGSLYIGQTITEAKNQVHPYPKNQKGETYGSLLDAASLGVEPDLILAQGVDGTIGYVRATDLNDVPHPKTPEEAVAYEKARTNAVRPIPLYAADGETVVGVFHAGGPSEVIKNPPKKSK